MQDTVSYTVHSFLLIRWGEQEYNNNVHNNCCLVLSWYWPTFLVESNGQGSVCACAELLSLLLSFLVVGKCLLELWYRWYVGDGFWKWVPIYDSSWEKWMLFHDQVDINQHLEGMQEIYDYDDQISSKL